MDPRQGPDRTTVHVRDAVQGKEEGIAWIAERFAPFVRSQVRLRLGPRAAAADVDDLSAEVWLVALRRLADLRPRAGRLTPVLLRFLGTTALQVVNNSLRRRIRGQAGSPTPVSELAASTRGVATRVAEAELGQQVRQCLEGMQDQDRHVLVLRWLEHRSNREIAAILGLKPNTVAVRYRRAMQRLRRMLPPELGADVLEGRPRGCSRGMEDG